MAVVSARSLYFQESGKTLEESNEEVRALREDANESASDALDLTLTANQTSMIIDLAKNALGRKMGPFWEIANGKLGDDFNLSDKEKKAFSKKCTEVLGRFEKDLCKVEDEWLNQVIDSVGVPIAQKKIKGLLGEPLKFNAPCMYIYLSGR